MPNEKILTKQNKARSNNTNDTNNDATLYRKRKDIENSMCALHCTLHLDNKNYAIVIIQSITFS